MKRRFQVVSQGKSNHPDGHVVLQCVDGGNKGDSCMKVDRCLLPDGCNCDLMEFFDIDITVDEKCPDKPKTK